VVFEASSVESPFASVFSDVQGAGGVAVSDIVTDTSDPERRFMPGHPDADADGYVAFPHMNPAEDMADLLGAARGYEANVASIGAVKDMIQRSIELLH
jgi:flagellar basal-body rod protein FlgC